MRINDLIWAAVTAWLADNRNGRPNFIAIPPEAFKQLTEELNAHLPRRLHYTPSHWNHIPVVCSPSETEIRCLP